MGWKDPDISAFRDYLARTAGDPSATIHDRRDAEDAWGLSIPLPHGSVVEQVSANGVPCGWISPLEGDENRTLFYVHGGGFGAGSSRSHGHFIARLAEAAGAGGLAVDYRLAPEHRFPAAVEDCVLAYRWLLSTGVDASAIGFAGDSAGGGLVFSLALAAKAQGLPPPGCLYAISPWADLSQSGTSHAHKAASDPMVTTPGLHRMASAYLGEADPRHPLASPVGGDFAGLPPTLIQVGSEEVLLSDSFALAERAALAGVDVRLEVWPEMVHIWPLYHDQLAAGRRALKVAGDWIRERLGAAKG